MFGFGKKKAEIKTAAQRLHNKVMTQSRDSRFYNDLEVSDDIDGRFDLLLLHAFFIIHGLESKGKQAAPLSQAFFDLLFRDVDQALRELGIGDLGIPKHMKRMMKAFNGRYNVYKQAYNAENRSGEMMQAIIRNIYFVDGEKNSTVPVSDDVLARFADYVTGNTEKLEACSFEDFMAGNIEFNGLEHYGTAGQSKAA